jgi:hypothetical protein
VTQFVYGTSDLDSYHKRVVHAFHSKDGNLTMSKTYESEPAAQLAPESTMGPSTPVNSADTETISSPTYLITEGEVMFGTAAVLSAAPSLSGGLAEAKSTVAEDKIRWYSALARMFAASKDRRPRTRHIPSRYDYTSDARMAREMERL